MYPESCILVPTVNAAPGAEKMTNLETKILTGLRRTRRLYTIAKIRRRIGEHHSLKAIVTAIDNLEAAGLVVTNGEDAVWAA